VSNQINLTCVSPSGIGNFAVCPLRLLYESDHPQPEDTTYACYRDFGTVCHYHAQVLKGVDPVPRMYDAETMASACRTPGSASRPDTLVKKALACGTKANEVIDAVTEELVGPLGSRRWLAEEHIYTTQFLAERVGRKGGRGYGGSVDLLLSDRSILWDYKFVGPRSFPIDQEGAHLKNEYLWQLGSYHLVSKVPRTGIVWTTRDAKCSCYLVIDWTQEPMQRLAAHLQSFMGFLESPMFRKVAWPVRGEACDYCKHKLLCPLYQVDDIRDSRDATMRREIAKNGDSLGALLLGGKAPVLKCSVSGSTPPPPPPAAWVPPPLPAGWVKLDALRLNFDKNDEKPARRV